MADIGCLVAQKTGRIDEEAATAAILKVRIQNRFAGRGNRLHHGIPTVQLIDDVAVDRAAFVLVRDLLCLLGTRRHRRYELDVRATFGQLSVDPAHDWPEIEADVGPVRPLLLRRVQRVDDADLG